ncbi:DNA topology modulation protein FlaR [Virgibacillus kekensis]|uniref:DNA topology modulation protein FlaR n=1 Tax=Virgibacillus kekensis TaxID=202261 RepID=A0ABV9DJL0_9BACI
MKLNKEATKKIRIIGSVGSGKTTLARELSAQLGIPYYELDNVIWIRDPSGDIRRTESERNDYLQQIIQSDTWIIEGVHNEEWTRKTFTQADLIVFLDLNYHLRTYRIIKRFIRQKAGIESANYQPTFSIFLKMFKWNRFFEKNGKPNFHRVTNYCSDRVIIVNRPAELRKLLQ